MYIRRNVCFLLFHMKDIVLIANLLNSFSFKNEIFSSTIPDFVLLLKKTYNLPYIVIYLITLQIKLKIFQLLDSISIQRKLLNQINLN